MRRRERAWVLAALALGACQADAAGDPVEGTGSAMPTSAEGDVTGDVQDGGLDSVDGGAATVGGIECPDLPAMITAVGIEEHLAAFLEHAIANDGNRAAGTAGYDASATYVRDVLEAAGYDVQLQSFDFERFSVNGPAVLEQTAPTPLVFSDDAFAVAEYSGAGDVTAAATGVTLDLGLDNASSSGCTPAEFDGFPAGNVALIQRGFCSFAAKVQNAEAAGAAGVVLFNQGSDGGNQDLFNGTLGSGAGVGIPVVFTDYATGETLAGAAAPVVRLVVDASVETVTTTNLLADTADGDLNDVVMYGAHLDSVRAGPGINDNGTGSAALLEVARAVAPCALGRRVRFAWWGAEEAGLLGSNHYVSQLSAPERSALRFYLNFDMIGSPNYARLVYDGDGSSFDNAGPGNSDELEALFVDYFNGLGLQTGPAAFDLRSDYAAFVNAGVPSGGIFTGAEATKSEDQEALYGGQAGEPFDACYHRACDTLDNVDLDLAAQIGEAIAHSVEVYALE